MNKKTKEILPAVLFFLAGIVFLISSLVGKDYAFTGMGGCFIVLGIAFGVKAKNGGKGDK